MTTKKENDEQPITDISIYIAALSVTYRPASTPAEATHFFSTPRGSRCYSQFRPFC